MVATTVHHMRVCNSKKGGQYSANMTGTGLRCYIALCNISMVKAIRINKVLRKIVVHVLSAVTCKGTFTVMRIQSESN